MLLLADAFYGSLEREGHCEYGGWGLDHKRPFGNSFVEGDILSIIGAEPEQPYDGAMVWSEEQIDYAAVLYDGLGDFLRQQWMLYKQECLAKGF